MAGIIKKQILKHLSRFTKNLSPDKINLSTLKGEGQLSNLELDEEVLQNMLDLPTWLAVTRVYCNKAAIRIQWTKLKTSPICLFLDKVEVEMRTCEEPRPPNGPSPIAITAGQSEYGFAEKVVEGMSVRINSITIKVQARAFHASFELWQLQGNSLNPKWERSDLRNTRIPDPKRGEVLTFKEINWQTLRIEADAIESDDQDLGSTPLRLITNQGRIQIALKRRIKDCNVLASKLLFILDDLLWVLTDSQLKAIIRYSKSLSEAMEKSAQQRKSMTAESLQTAPPSPGLHNLWTDSPPPPSASPNNTSHYFDRFDVKESSYHTFVSRLDLHVCNDSSSVAEDVEEPPVLQGAMQLTFRKLGFDYYPVHRPADGCRHWERYSGAMDAQAQWAGKLLQEYQRRADASVFPGPHTVGPEPHNNSPAKRAQDGATSPKSRCSEKDQIARSQSSSLKRLRSSCVVVRMDDVDIHQVSTKGRQNKKTKPLLSCNRKALHLPDNVPAIHLQFTEYYFPNNSTCSVPTANLYSQDSSKADEHVDIRLDAAQLKPTPPCPYPRDRLAFCAIPSSFLQHSLETTPPPVGTRQLRSQDVWSLSLSRVTLGFDGARILPKGKTQPFIEPFAMSAWMCQPSGWTSGSCSPSIPSVGHQPSSEPPKEDASLASFHLIAHAITPVKMWLNHYQYVALLRMKDALARLGMELSRDQRDIREACDQKTKPVTVCLAMLLDLVEVGLLLPPAVTEPEEEILHTPETDSPSITDSDISPTHQSEELIPEDSSLENGVASLSAALNTFDQDGTVEEAHEAVEEGLEGDASTPLEETPIMSPQLSPGISPALSREPSTFSLEGELSSAINVTKDATKDAISASLDLTKGAFSITKDAFSMLSRGSGMSKLFSPHAKEQVQRPEESTPSLATSLRQQMMKQSPSQHSFDSAILDGSLPDENLSVGSDISDNFVVLMESESCGDSPHFNINPAGSQGSPAPATEGGSSADLSSSLSLSIEDVSPEMSSVLLLILSGTACTMEVNGEDQVIAVQAQNLNSVQMGNIRVSDLLAGLIQAPAHKQNGQSSRDSPAVCMRVETGPSAGRHTDTAFSTLNVRVQDCHAELLASTLANIGPFLEDEFSVDGQPIKLHLSNVTVTVKDDSPRVYPTAPQPTSATFIVDQLLLQRSDDGIMRLRAEGQDNPNKSCSVQKQSELQALESKLSNTKVALNQALSDRERLLLEIKKYDPKFSL
ncbi:bridge-like lipid transfer protein family member 3A isoform X4 [Entelurus aequoreus]|uniref:bridge-like lipid transfer protein family member 3A isoform X4 n=1 Tax=Entelurus aequoreus TaxID=161455 RepID=UPI002B1DCEDE|nr:bridge-like lipid transfer protein family member 3A isoform X4 [Entelurus aequoreus]